MIIDIRDMYRKATPCQAQVCEDMSEADTITLQEFYKQLTEMTSELAGAGVNCPSQVVFVV